MKQKAVIGVAGMPGSGKATVRIVAESMGFSAVVMGDEVREETRRRGLEPTPENIGRIMLQLREEEGLAAVANRCIPKIVNAKSDIVFVDGVRSLSEVDEFKKSFDGFALIAVHSSPDMRFQRLSKRQRSDDPKGWEVFHERDLRELGVGQGDVIAVADYMIVNEGTYKEFEAKVRDLLKTAVQKWTKS
jgi:dephospho-CoA kinase